MNRIGIFEKRQSGKVRLVRRHYTPASCAVRHSWIAIAQKES
ncbi:hypothetical protein [Phocaeicola faecalis]|nr:hypothetical protein [Phocaeicola faecalis]